MRRLPAALFLLSAVALVAQAQTPARETPPSRAGSASIRGRVVGDDDIGTPIRNARVSVTSPAGSIPTVLADSDGRFAITSLAAGRYVVSASKPGYVKTIAAGRPGDPASPVDLTAGVTVERLEIRMPRSAAISGRVWDDLGDPVIGATVTADYIGRESGSRAGAKKPSTTWTAHTNDLGEYRLAGLGDGSFAISVVATPMLNAAQGSVLLLMYNAVGVRDAPASGSSRMYYPGVTDLAGAQPISVSRGEERSGVDLVLQSRAQSEAVRATDATRASTSADTGAIRGRIVSVDGRPAGRARIGLTRLLRGPVTGRVTDADDDGSYEFRGIAPGDYLVAATKRGFVETRFGRRAQGELINVTPGQVRDRIDITLSPFGAIEGRLLDEYGDPLEGARVRALQSRFVAGRQQLVVAPQIQPALTDDRGRYRLSSVAPGQYYLSSLIGQVLVNMPMADVPGYAPTYFPSTEHAAEAQAISVELSQVVSDADIMVKRTATARIAGVALRADGGPVQGNLTIRPSVRSGTMAPLALGARIDRDGTFEFPNLAPGEYVIKAAANRRSPSTEGELASLVVPLNGVDVTDLMLRASSGSTISGHITLDGVASVAPGSIELTPFPVDPDRSADQVARADVRADWTFDLAGINGPRRFRLGNARGWALKAIYLDGADVLDRPLPFGTTAQSVRGLEVVLTDRVTELSGRVSDGNGRAVNNWVVIAFGVDRESWYPGSRFVDQTARPQADGRFVITGLPPGEYFVAALARRPPSEDDGQRQDPAFLDAIAGQAQRIILLDGQKVTIDPKLLSRP
ncbi:MAG: carboxypeptidase-like regulatory domain-containing protein [Acidobacteriota bacterium]